ncbi:MAG: sulfatase-like hydrolase/transferase [Anaerolineae bacterium]|nr:sulfatase-like hydrolase/transferase [Anaerolineae bacterium]
MRSPNLLFIFTDEQRYDTMAAYGNRAIETPALNRLAAQSVVFERAYVTQSVCTPSRSSILTGLYPHTNGCTENNIPLPADVPCLPEMLAPGAYATAYHGKWHLGDEVFAQHGFEEWRSIEDGYAPYYGAGRDRDQRSTYHHWLIAQGCTPRNGASFGRGEAARLPEALGKPAYLAQEASRYIREHQHEPFVLYVNFLEPHMPFYGPRDDQYDPAQIPLPPNFEARPTDRQPLKARLFERAYYQRGHSGLPLQTEADWRRMIANYWGLCSLVDTHVGAILDTLADCGLEENTIVVYTSDHGDMMGSHRLIAKCVAFEEAVRVPLLVRLPGQRSAVRVPQPVSQIDLAPTLLDLMGQPIPDGLQGASLRPAIDGQPDRAPHDVFIEWNGHNNGLGDVIGQVSVPEEMRDLAPMDDIVSAITDPVRTVITPDGWKFNCSTRGEHELYYLHDDPLELVNRAGPDMAPRMAALADRIRAWQARTGDTVPLPMRF